MNNMVYVPDHTVVVPNFRERDVTNPYDRSRFLYCSVEDIQYVQFTQKEISDFIRNHTKKRLGGEIKLEDLMVGGRFNVSPFTEDDSLVPLIFGGFMLGEGCMTQQEFLTCRDPLGEDEFERPNELTSLITNLNDVVYPPFLFKESGVRTLGSIFDARRSRDRSLNIFGNKEVYIAYNPVTSVLLLKRSFGDIEQKDTYMRLKVPRGVTRLMTKIEQEKSLRINPSERNSLVHLNSILKRYKNLSLKKVGGHDGSYELVSSYS